MVFFGSPVRFGDFDTGLNCHFSLPVGCGSAHERHCRCPSSIAKSTAPTSQRQLVEPSASFDPNGTGAGNYDTAAVLPQNRGHGGFSASGTSIGQRLSDIAHGGLGFAMRTNDVTKRAYAGVYDQYTDGRRPVPTGKPWTLHWTSI